MTAEKFRSSIRETLAAIAGTYEDQAAEEAAMKACYDEHRLRLAESADMMKAELAKLALQVPKPAFVHAICIHPAALSVFGQNESGGVSVTCGYCGEPVDLV